MLLLRGLCLVACDTPITSTPEDEIVYTSDWAMVEPGVEYRVLSARPSNSRRFDMHIVRLDPNQVGFRVHYTPGQPKSFSDWQVLLQNSALAFVNANFFTEANLAIGLVITDGIPHGNSLTGYGGMFQVDMNGTPRVRSLVREGYGGEPLQQAVQAYPMLVELGGVQASTGAGFDDPARRTVIAQDRNGRILLISTGLLGEISFNDLQEWLLTSELDVQVAFALDGGKSSALFVNRTGLSPITVPSYSPFPVALAVYER